MFKSRHVHTFSPPPSCSKLNKQTPNRPTNSLFFLVLRILRHAERMWLRNRLEGNLGLGARGVKESVACLFLLLKCSKGILTFLIRVVKESRKEKYCVLDCFSITHGDKEHILTCLHQAFLAAEQHTLHTHTRREIFPLSSYKRS